MESLMKKILVLLTSMLLLVSCQNDFDDEFDKDLTNALQTKSSVSVPSVLSQLSGIPVNIRLKSGNQNYSYLSTSKKNSTVDLHVIDDGSLRQRWLISSGGASIKVEGGAYINGYLTTIGTPRVPIITNIDSRNIGMFKGPTESTYHIYISYIEPSTFQQVKAYLYSVDAENRDLAFAEENKTGGRHVWEIIPVESFEILDVKFAQEVTDRVAPSLKFIRAYNLSNINGPSPLTHTFNVSEEYTESSTFGKTEGLTTTSKISNSTSFKIGLPLIGGDGKVDTEMTTEKSWTYSENRTVTNKKTISDTFGYTAPPYTNIRIDLYLMVYDLNVTYIMTLKGNKSGRIIKLKGKWEGVESTEFTYEPKIVAGNANQVVPEVEGKLNKSDFERMHINK